MKLGVLKAPTYTHAGLHGPERTTLYGAPATPVPGVIRRHHV